MANDNKDLKDILLANWSLIQKLIENSSSLRWKIRGGLFGIWWASILFDLEKNKPQSVGMVFIIVILGFIYEFDLKKSEEKLIYKTREIEKQLNAIAIGDYESLFRDGIKIGTSLPKATSKFTSDSILSKERWKFHAPYFVIALSTLVYIALRIIQ